MTSGAFKSCLSAFGVLLALAAVALRVQGQSLAVTYGSKGIQTLSFGGTMLEDTAQHPEDIFHIGHLACTDLQGNLIGDPRCSWGETNRGESWNTNTRTETYSFAWGSIAAEFAQHGNNLDITITETNNAASGIILLGSDVIPLAFHFPNDPVNFYGYNQNVFTTTGPGVMAADFGTGVVTAVIPDESPSLYGGWKAQGGAVYSPIIASTAPDGLATFYPRVNSPVRPGQSLSYTVSLRFTPKGVAANAEDAYSSFAAKYPSQMTWTDKRIIGTAYLASSPSGDPSRPGGFPTNPRRYFNDPSLDVTSAAGIRSFQTRMLNQATSNVANAQALGAQGVVTWDIEGEQFPQTTSYVCAPDQIATVAPEMESVIADASSPYYGKKLDDAYFATMKGSGLKVGVCLRPQVFTLAPDGSASQTYLSSNSAIVANLEKKARYAYARWGATLFYVDSTVDANGGVLDPEIFHQLITDMPNVLFIPEESTPRYYAYSAPFYTFIFHTDLGTPASAYKVYPNAFGANLINDADPSLLARYKAPLTQSVRRGDILMGHADWWQPNNPTLVSIYEDAAGGAPKGTPQISWSAPFAISFGTPLSGIQLNATANVAGAFTYSPPQGTVLNAGTSILTTVFSPADLNTENTASSSVNLTVTQGLPVLTWPKPTAVNRGAILSAAQLNATANVPGVFNYSPAAGSVVSSGTTLVATFLPSDAVNYESVTASVFLDTDDSTAGKVTITSPSAGTAVSGIVSVDAQITVPLDPAGSYLIVDGAPAGSRRVSNPPYLYPLDTSTLSNGAHTLQVWAHDIGNNTWLSAPVAVTVSNGSAPKTVISWPIPSPIMYGTALSAAQLNATAKIPGTFSYSPSIGEVLGAGVHTLSVTFSPDDPTKYSATQTSVNLVIQQAIPSITWPPPSPVSEGTLLSGAQLNAAATVPGTMTYSPAAGSKLNAGTLSLNVAFTPSDLVNYKPNSASVSLTVTGTPVSALITWPPPASITYGIPLSATQLNATANVPGTFSYTPASGTIVPAGAANLTTVFTPADTMKYQTGSAAVSLNVEKAVPIITWPTPSPVMSGDALSSVQLNAASNIAGSFTYSPAVGAILPTGISVLTATFVPADQTNYISQTTQVSLLVNSSRPQPVAILTPVAGAVISGSITVSARVGVPLDPAGSYLMVDGRQIGTRRVSDGPYVYPFDTTTVANGSHTLQIWAHDIGNNVHLSLPVTVEVEN